MRAIQNNNEKGNFSILSILSCALSFHSLRALLKKKQMLCRLDGMPYYAVFLATCHTIPLQYDSLKTAASGGFICTFTARH